MGKKRKVLRIGKRRIILPAKSKAGIPLALPVLILLLLVMLFFSVNRGALREERRYDLAAASVDGIADVMYTGSEITQDFSVMCSGDELKEGRDYTVAYENNVGPGMAKVTIKGIGRSSGEIRRYFAVKSHVSRTVERKEYSMKFSRGIELDYRFTAAKFKARRVLATAKDDGCLVSWRAPAANEEVSGYAVLRRKTGSSEYRQLSLVGKDRRKYKDTGAKAGTLYDYIVVPYVSHGSAMRLYPESDWVRAARGRRNLYEPKLNRAKIEGLGSKGREVTIKVTNIKGVADATLRWSSDDRSVATVKDGVVKAVGNGTTRVRVRSATGRTVACTVKVELSKAPPEALDHPTRIEVSLEKQHLTYYVDGKVKIDTDIISGMPTEDRRTHPGTYKVENLMANVTMRGPDWNEFANYWVGFIGVDTGFHDRPGQKKFGGRVYEKEGSHGCVVLPIDEMEKFYNSVEKGTPVYIY